MMSKNCLKLFLTVSILSWVRYSRCSNGPKPTGSEIQDKITDSNITNSSDPNNDNSLNRGPRESLLFVDNSASALKNINNLTDYAAFSDLFQSSISDLSIKLNQDIELNFDSGSVSQQNSSNNHKSQSSESKKNDFLFISDPKNHTSDNCYIIKIKSSTSAAILKKLSNLFGAISAKINKHYKHGFQGYHVCFPENSLPLALMKEIPFIEFVERDNIVKSAQVQENAPWGLARLSNPDPRYKYFGFDGTGEGVTVYVIDSGLAKTKELGNRATLGYTVYPNLPSDCAGHGTQVASLIAGTNVGVAKKANVVVAQVLDCLGDGKNSDLIDALSWVIETHQKPAIINMSLGGDRSPSIEKAVQAAISAGIPVVVSAGNSNIDACTQSPAAVAEAITVAASTQKNSRAKFSNFGPCVDIFAPGVDILAATTVQKSRNGWKFSSGTSFASPFVSGVSALLLEKNPEMTPAQLLETIKSMGAVGVMKSNDLNGTPNILVQAPPSDSKFPILVKLAEPGYLPMQGYHTSSIMSTELILVIVSFIIATLALFATGGALIRRQRRQKISENSSITEEDLKHSVINSQRPSVFL